MASFDTDESSLEAALGRIMSRHQTGPASSKAFHNINAVSSLMTHFQGSTRPGQCRQWIKRLEMAFKLAGGDVDDSAKVAFAGLKLKNAAEEWFQGHADLLLASPWEYFKSQLIQRFDPSAQFTEAQLRNLRQDERESLEDYFTKFQALMALCSDYSTDQGYPESAYHYFVQGVFRDDVRIRILEGVAAGKSTEEAIEAVVRIEKTVRLFNTPLSMPDFRPVVQRWGTGRDLREPPSSGPHVHKDNPHQLERDVHIHVPGGDPNKKYNSAVDKLSQQMQELKIFLMENRFPRQQRHGAPPPYPGPRGYQGPKGLNPAPAKFEHAKICEEIIPPNVALPSVKQEEFYDLNGQAGGTLGADSTFSSTTEFLPEPEVLPEQDHYDPYSDCTWEFDFTDSSAPEFQTVEEDAWYTEEFPDANYQAYQVYNTPTKHPKKVHFQAHTAAPMEIDTPQRQPPRDNRGRFAAVPFPTGVVPNQTPRQQLSQNTPEPVPNISRGSWPPAAARLPQPVPAAHQRPPFQPANQNGSRQNIRKQPQAAVPFPLPNRSQAVANGTNGNNLARAPPSQQTRPANTSAPGHHSELNAQRLAKQVKNAAFNTPVTLTVGQLTELAPMVRREIKDSGNATNQNADAAANLCLPQKSPYLAAQINPMTKAPISIARTTALINGVPQTAIVDTGCTSFLMGLGAVRQCGMLSLIDQSAGKDRTFKVANGEIDTPLGIIHGVQVKVGDVTVHLDAAVCRAETTDILLGAAFLFQVDGVIRFNPPQLEMTNSSLQKCTVPLDFTGHNSLHETVYMAGRPRRYSPMETQAIKLEVDKLLDAKVCRPSHSPYASNPLLVKKPDGSMRMCIDYRPLNAITVPDPYPMPRADDIFDSIGDARVFSIIDLKSGFHQLPIREADIPKTAFITPFGNFEYIKMPFGLRCAPATFQRAMDQTLSPYLGQFARVYLDDVLVYSKDMYQHLQHLDCILGALQRDGLRANPAKCKFAIKECKYLGHVVDSAGIRPCPEKVSAIQNMLPPNDVAGVRSLLGLFGYYRRFVKNFSSIAAPINALLQQERTFDWTQECQQAFLTLKAAILSDAVLHRPDFSLPYKLQVDWSGEGLGAVLSQVIDGVERPISFQSRSLTPAEKKYHSMEGEALAAVWGVHTFRPYLQGTVFLLETDCKALQWLKEQPNPPSRLGRWLLKLSEFQFEIKHKAGKKNGNADALSRLPNFSAQPCDITDRPLLPFENFMAGTCCMYEEVDLDRTEQSDSSDGKVGYETEYVPTKPQEEASFSFVGGGTRLAYDPDELDAPVHPGAVCSCCEKEGDPAQLLVCEGCEILVHTTCCDPPLQRIPEGDYFCPSCLSEGKRVGPTKDISEDAPVIEYLKSGQCQETGAALARIRKRAKHYSWEGNTLYKRASGRFGKRKIPAQAEREGIIRAFHEKCGHFGIKRTESLIAPHYTWTGMREDIATFIQDCHACKEHASKFNTDPTLHPIPVTPTCWHTVGIDIVGPFPTTTEGNRYAIVCIDYFSKWIEASAMQSANADEAAEFLETALMRYGALAKVRTDQGRHFQGPFKKILDENFIDHQMSRAYHPQSNGLVERAIQTLSRGLKASCSAGLDTEEHWDELLPSVVMGYNMSQQASTGATPFHLMHGWQPKPLLGLKMVQPCNTPAQPESGIEKAAKVALPDDNEERVGLSADYWDQLAQRHRDMAEQASSRAKTVGNIVKAQARQVRDFNKRHGINADEAAHPADNYKEGDLVLTRVVNPNQLRPGQLAGATKLKGAVRGPFMYVKQFSQRYASVRDNAKPPNVWEKAYHDIIPYDHSRSVHTYKVKEFPISTAEAYDLEVEWAKDKAKPAKHARSETLDPEEEQRGTKRRRL